MLTMLCSNSGQQRRKQRHNLLDPQRADHVGHANQLQRNVEHVHKGHQSDHFDQYSFGRYVVIGKYVGKFICSVAQYPRLGGLI